MSLTARTSSLAFGALLALLACASDRTIPVSTNYDPLVRFPTEATFVWDDAANSLPDDLAMDRAATDALLKEVATEAFAARGYHAAGSNAAHYRLSYQFVAHSYIGPDVSRAIGSLSFLLLERASGRRVWLGFGRAEIHMGLSPEERRARLRDAMTRMLEDFPPSQRPAS